jgi:hypothetical protein
MVKLADVRTAKAKSFIDDASYVAVFLGASMGLGEYFINELARVYGNGGQGTLFVVLVGRSQSKMQRVIDFCLALAPTAQFEFVDIQDAALISSKTLMRPVARLKMCFPVTVCGISTCWRKRKREQTCQGNARVSG